MTRTRSVTRRRFAGNPPPFSCIQLKNAGIPTRPGYLGA
jgi:hypothetical protein